MTDIAVLVILYGLAVGVVALAGTALLALGAQIREHVRRRARRRDGGRP
ncbi:MAG: hypothetical protein FWE15_04660 [Actinomycetia bacterium]|nr:hypothetical protein [Actinomycetes bacterium]